MILAPEDSISGMLRIPVVRERDAGVYTCRAVNELGDASAEIRLEVGRECTPVPTCAQPPALQIRDPTLQRTWLPPAHPLETTPPAGVVSPTALSCFPL